MGIEMTGQTLREHLELPFIMRFGVTLAAIGDLAVLLVTHATHHVAVLAGGPFPLGVNGLMAAAAGPHVGVGAEGDLQGGVNLLMAFAAGDDRLLLVVTVMTLEAVRNVPVAFVVTGLTALIAVSAWQGNEFTGRAWMTIGAGCCQPVNGRHPTGCVRVLMTVEAVKLSGAVRLAVASTADRHQRIVVVLARVIGVNDLVALLAGEAVFATGLLEIAELTGVTLSALCRCQRYGWRRVKLRVDLGQSACPFRCQSWLGRKPSQDDYSKTAER